MKHFIIFLAIFMLIHVAQAELKSLDSDELESHVSAIELSGTQKYQHRLSFKADFDLGATSARANSCKNSTPRKNRTFNACWQLQHQTFINKLTYGLNIKGKSAVKTQFSFDLSKSGKIKNIRVVGLKNEMSRTQLKSVLQSMEFGYSEVNRSERISLNVYSHIVK